MGGRRQEFMSVNRFNGDGSRLYYTMKTADSRTLIMALGCLADAAVEMTKAVQGGDAAAGHMAQAAGYMSQSADILQACATVVDTVEALSLCGALRNTARILSSPFEGTDAIARRAIVSASMLTRAVCLVHRGVSRNIDTITIDVCVGEAIEDATAEIGRLNIALEEILDDGLNTAMDVYYLNKHDRQVEKREEKRRG